MGVMVRAKRKCQPGADKNAAESAWFLERQPPPGYRGQAHLSLADLFFGQDHPGPGCQFPLFPANLHPAAVAAPPI